MPLINRLIPAPYESLSSLLHRLQQANYYDEPQWMAAFLAPDEATRLDLLRCANSYAALADLLHITIDQLYRLTLHRFVPACYGNTYPQVAQAGHVYLPDDIRLPLWERQRQDRFLRFRSRPHICPLCWRDQHAYVLPWWLHLVTSCPRHQIVLTSVCRCGAPPTACSPDLVCTHCGAPIPIIAADDAASQALASLVWSAIGCSDEPFPPPSLGCAASHPVHSMTPTICLEFLRQGARLLEEQHAIMTGLIHPDTVTSSHAHLAAVTRTFLDWPEQWDLLLEQVLERAGVTGTTDRCLPDMLQDRFIGNVWEWLYETWIQQTLARVRDERQSYYWLSAWSAQRQYQDLRGLPLVMTRSEVMRLVGGDETNLQQLSDSHLLHTTATLADDGNAAWHYLSALKVLWLRDEQERRWPLSRAAAYLGISEEQVKMLVTAGLLETAQPLRLNSPMEWIFLQEHLDALLQMVLGEVPVQAPPADHTDILRLDQVVRLVQADGVQIPRVLWAIRQGHLPASRAEDALRLTTLWFTRTAVLAYRAAQHEEQQILVSIQHVRDRLHCDFNALDHLARAGILVPYVDDEEAGLAGWQYDPADVIALLQRYVDSDDTGIILGVTRAISNRWAQVEWLTAELGPAIDGRYMYCLDQAAATIWSRTRLTIGEAVDLRSMSRADLYRWMQQGKLTLLEDIAGIQQWLLY